MRGFEAGLMTVAKSHLRKSLNRDESALRRGKVWVPAPLWAVDPVAAGVDQRTLAMPEAFARFAAPPVFICGSARSGTTWTCDLFDRHPQVCAICESWLLSQTQGVTGVLAQPNWNPRVNERWRQGIDVPVGAVELVSYEEMVRDLGSLVAKWLANKARAEHRFLIAKEFLDVRATSILFPEARFVHVIRDGRNVALSMRRAGGSWNPSMGADMPIELHAEAWRRQLLNIRAHREYLGERYLEIRYEHMRADVVGAMRTLFDFARIPYDEALLERIRGQTELSSYAEGARRSGFRGGGGNHTWREVFSASDAFRFSRAAGDLLVELGYEDGRRWLLSRLQPRGRRAAVRQEAR